MAVSLIRIRSLLGLFSALIISMSAWASDSPTLKDVVEAEQSSASILRETEFSGADNHALPRTPLQSILGLTRAVQDKDWQQAGLYMDTRYLAEELAGIDKAQLIRQLNVIWSQNRVLDLATVSDEPEGHLDDGLPSYRDLLGSLDTRNGEVPIYMQRIPDGESGFVWKISNATVGMIPQLWNEFGYHPWVFALASVLPEFKFLYLHSWQWASLLMMVLAAWLLTAAVREFLLALVKKSRRYHDSMQRFVRVPLRLFLFFILLQQGVGWLGLSINARVWLEAGTLSYLAILFLIFGAIEFAYALISVRVSTRSYWQGVLRPLVNVLKIFALITLLLTWFRDAGYNITTILTGLGIGSLAFALAAQKTLENVFGTFTLYLAKPINPGDFCRFGDTLGVVEEVGLRSTCIRKLDRSVVYVPNAVFASEKLENLSRKDMSLYRRTFRLRLQTSVEQLEALLQRTRELLQDHSQVVPDNWRVQLEDVGADAFLMVVNAYLDEVDYSKYLHLCEGLNLDILKCLEAEDVALAVPERRLQLEGDVPDGISPT